MTKIFLLVSIGLTSGSYLIKNLKEGPYHLELHSFEISARRLSIDSIHVTGDSTINLTTSYPGPCQFNYPKDFKPGCAYGHSDNIVRIVYGYPTQKNMRKAKKGLIHLGGCVISDCDPRYYCTIHNKDL
ncbi:MAG: hypothetical protein JWQ27_55 [Ferruginibacter sp.]|nr:hypothetical protein [Ferruginibacter sp.]